MRRAVCPGSFDPVTNGHLDIISRASKLFDEVVVAVGVNKSKNRLFSAEERMQMLRDVCGGYGNVQVDGFDGLLTSFCAERGIHAIVKGLRAVSDFDYELQMAQMNHGLQGVETMSTDLRLAAEVRRLRTRVLELEDELGRVKAANEALVAAVHVEDDLSTITQAPALT